MSCINTESFSKTIQVLKLSLLCFAFGACLITMPPLILNSQTYHFKTYTIDDGLAQSQVLYIFQDSDGFLWFATNGGGVSKFDGNKFENYTQKEGLVNNTVYNIFEDTERNLWFGTIDGLSMYDGHSFVNYTTEDGLINKYVRSVCEDTKRRIWVATSKGISVMSFKDKKTKQFEIKNLDNKDGLLGIDILCIVKDTAGNLWIGTDEGANLVNPELEDKFVFSHFTFNENIANNAVRTIIEDPAGNIWLGTGRNGIYKITFNNNDHHKYKIENINVKNIFPRKDLIYKIIKDKKNNLWVAQFGGGVTRIVFRDKSFTDFDCEHYSTANGLPYDKTASVCEDFEGNIWIGTYGSGVSKYSGKTFESFTIKNGLDDNFVWAIMEDEKNNIWVGTDFGGISKFNFNVKGVVGSIENFGIKKRLNSNRIRAIHQDKNGNFWFGTSNGITKLEYNEKNKSKIYKYYTTLEGLVDNDIRSIFEDKEGNMWFGSINGGLSKLNIKLKDGNQKVFQNFTIDNGLIYNAVYSVLEDKFGDIWVATGGGLSRIMKSDNPAKPDIINYTTLNGLPHDEIRNIISDKAGNLYIGTGGGFSILYHDNYQQHELKFKNFTSKDGLSSDRLYLMLFDKDENLWIGTNIGVDKFDLKAYNANGTINFKYYGYLDGFIGIETNTNAACLDHNGNLWFGTIGGLIKYNPAEDKTNKNEVRTHITKLKVFMEETEMVPGLQLAYDKNHVSFEFTGISFINPEKIKYQYKLDGLDNQWSPVTKETRVTYSNLPHGEFSFNVKACSNAELWNKVPVTYSFVIYPPFWQTLWFRVCCVILVVVLVAGVIKIRERNLRKLQKELKNRINERTVELSNKNKSLEDLNKTLEEAHAEVLSEKKKVDNISAELKRSNKDLQDFAFIASHDLKEPLRKITFFLERLNVISKENLSETSNDYINRVMNAATRMKGLIEGLLKYSRVSTKQKPFTKVDLKVVVEEVLSDLEIRIKETNGQVVVKNLPVIQADRLQMHQLFQNLIGNALKFIKPGIPPVVTVDSKNLKNGTWEITIHDNGIGFDEKYLNKIFQPFQRLHTRTEFEGTGIGTAICHKIAIRHNGEITARSLENIGTTFIITLPENTAGKKQSE